jgi:hypothetical protein
MKNTILIIIFLGIFSYLIDILTASKDYYQKCINNKLFHIELLLHHIIVIFIFFGWLSNNKYILLIYLFIPIILISHWKMNNNRCKITEDVNNLCDLDKDEYIRDFLYIVGLKKTKYYDSFYKFFLIFTFIYVIYKLYKLHHK